MIILALTSFIAGILTVLSPCALPLLPVILGGSLQNNSRRRPLWIIGSLAVSILVFTLVIKAGVIFLNIDENLLRVLSGIVLLILGIFTFFPNLYGTIALKLGINQTSAEGMQKANQTKGTASAILTGLALGPVFTTCSPMFGYILFAILPVSLGEGLLYIIMFIAGLSLFLYLISVLGQRLISRTKWAANPNGNFKKFLGILFIVIGIMIIFKVDKYIESFLLEQPVIQNILFNRVEQNIIDSL